MRVVSSLSLAILLASCSDPVSPPRAVVSALDVVELRLDRPGELQMTVAVRVENVTDDDIYFAGCASSLEREVSPEKWEPFGGVTCLLMGYVNPLDGMQKIAAGGVREMPLQLYAWGKTGIDLFASTYRLKLIVATPVKAGVVRGMGYDISNQVLVTNEFTLKQK